MKDPKSICRSTTKRLPLATGTPCRSAAPSDPFKLRQRLPLLSDLPDAEDKILHLPPQDVDFNDFYRL